MTNLEKALLERVEELNKNLEKANKYAADLFNSNVRMGEVLCAIEDHLYLLKGDDEPMAVFMENVYDSDESTDFDKIYECFKNTLEHPEEAEQEKAE